MQIQCLHLRDIITPLRLITFYPREDIMLSDSFAILIVYPQTNKVLSWPTKNIFSWGSGLSDL